MIVLIVLARLLSPKDFGLIGVALVVVGFCTLFSQLGVGPAIVQRPKLEDRHLWTAFTSSLLLGLLLSMLVAATAPWIARFFSTEGLVPILRTLALLFPISGLAVVAEALMRREMRFRQLATLEIVSYGVGFGIVGIVFASMGFGVWALVGAHLVRAVTSTTLSLYVQPHPKLLRIEQRAFQELMFFGGGFTLARVLNYTALQGDNFVVGRWLGAEALGLYSRAYQLLVVPVNLFGSVLDQVLFASMAKLQHDVQRLKQAYKRGVAVIALAFVPISITAVIVAPEIIMVLLGPKWMELVGPFQILAVGMLFRTSYKMSDSLARATGAVYRRAWRQGVYALSVVGGTLIGQRWGLEGVAVSVLVALAINFFLMAQLSLQLAPITWREFFSLHSPALFFGILTLLEVWGITSGLRYLAVPDIAVLFVTAAVILFSLLALPLLAPRLVGPEGLWVFHAITRLAGEKFNRLGVLSKLQGPKS